MGLPTDRNQTYVNGTPVAPADLNDLQDAVKYGWHGDLWFPLPVESAIEEHATATWTSGDHWVLDATGSLYIPIPFPRDTRIKELRFCFKINNIGSRFFWAIRKRPTTVTDGIGVVAGQFTGAIYGTADTDQTVDSTFAHFTTGVLPVDLDAATFPMGARLYVDYDSNLYSAAALISRGE